MCGVSGVELVVVLAAALVIIGPDKLPEVMGALGKLMRQVRELTGELSNVRREIVDTVPIKDLKKKVKDELGVSELTKVTKSATDEVDALRKRMREMGAAAAATPAKTTERLTNAPKTPAVTPAVAPSEAPAEGSETEASPTAPAVEPVATAGNDELSEIDAIRARLKARAASRDEGDGPIAVAAAPHPSVPGMGASVQVGGTPAAPSDEEASDE